MDKKVIDELVAASPMIAKAHSYLKAFSEDEILKEKMEAHASWVRDRLTEIEYAQERGLREGLEKGLKDGLEQGLEKGRRETQLSLARKMLARGMSIEEIASLTELTKEELAAMKP